MQRYFTENLEKEHRNTSTWSRKDLKTDIEIEQKNFEISKIRNYICQETGGKPLKFNNMAMSIKEIPVLTGQCAVDFVSAADANSQNQTPKITPQQADRIKDVMEKSKSFSFSN